jgi:hypothetical protein
MATRGSIPDRARLCSFFTMSRLTKFHPASCPIGSGGFFTEVKADRSPPSSGRVKYAWNLHPHHIYAFIISCSEHERLSKPYKYFCHSETRHVMQDCFETLQPQRPGHMFFRLNGSWKDDLIEVKCFILISIFSEDGWNLPKCV